MSESTRGSPTHLGSRLRRRRKALYLTLQAVADQTSLTTSYLSQLERGRTNASVATLQRICQVLRLDVGDLFSDGAAQLSPVLRFTDAHRMDFGQDASKVRLTPQKFDHLEMLLGTLGPHGSTGVEPYTHGDAEELLLVISGQVTVTVDGISHRLGELDSMQYRSSQPHRVEECAGAPARVLWAMSPPTY